MSLLDSGHLIFVDIGHYVDSNVHSIYFNHADEVVFSSEVYTDYLLSEIPESNVRVYAPATTMWKHNNNSIAADELAKYGTFKSDLLETESFTNVDPKHYGINMEDTLIVTTKELKCTT
jgi:hypothetical protein